MFQGEGFDLSDELQLPYLETFSRAAELSSFTAATKSLRVTQAAVSQRVQALEKTLGTPLFKRQGGRVLLTEVGRLHAVVVRDLHCDRDMYVVQDRRRVLSQRARLFVLFLETHPVAAETP